MPVKKDELAPYLFKQGTNFKAYEYLGAHLVGDKKEKTCVFRTWAPNADKVFV